MKITKPSYNRCLKLIEMNSTFGYSRSGNLGSILLNIKDDEVASIFTLDMWKNAFNYSTLLIFISALVQL